MEQKRNRINLPKFPSLSAPIGNASSGRKRPNIFIYLLIFIAIWGVLSLLSSYSDFYNSQFEPISKVVEDISAGQVKKVEIRGNEVTAHYQDGKEVKAVKGNQDFTQLLSDNKIPLDKIPEGVTNINQLPILDLLGTLAPIILTALFFFFIFRQARGAAGDIFNFGKSRARIFLKTPKDKITFDDVAGASDVKKEVTEVVDFLKNPNKYRRLGARIPKGVLLIGPSGVGKTLLARAIAGEADVPFFSVAGSEFIEMLVGVGASRARDMFSMAKSAQPSVIFIDEIDAIGRQRGMGFTGGHDEREQTLNQILVEMDGFDQRTNVIVLAATNRPDLLDPALVRPGRFDRRVTLDLPDINEREEIFKIHMRGKPFSKDVDIKRLSEQTVGFSGADIENLINEGAIFAARRNENEISMKDLVDAATKVKLGPERRRMQDEEEKKITAYHEAGHALVAYKLPNTDPVQRVSIISRSMALGFTDVSPQRDRYNETKTRLLEFITMALSGRAAEKLIFNEETVGAASDIEKATQLARRMVTEFGMSSLGPIQFATDEKKWLAIQLGENSTYSEEMAKRIDSEVRKIINSCFKNAQKILKDNKNSLEKLAQELIKKETLERDEFEALLKSAA